MKRTLLNAFVLALCFAGTLFAQSVTGVSTAAMNKVAIMEEFTGVRCTFCPDGHTVILGIEQTNPNDFFVVSMHPDNSGLTAPYGSDPDLRRNYPAAFYSTPYCGSSRFMPSAFINRRVWANERIQGRSSWPGRVAEITAESSPANVGVLASYDSLTNMLSVTVEVYYTGNVTEANHIYAVLSEDNITVQQQAGASGAYVQDRVLRAGLSAQWGDAITTATTMGSMATMTYTFDNSTTMYDMSSCRVTAYVENQTSGELYTGMQKSVVFNQTVGVTAPMADMNVKIVPNPFSENATIQYHLDATEDVEMRVYNMTGQMLMHEVVGAQPSGDHAISIDAVSNGLAAGMYMVQLRAGTHTVTKNMIVN